jgi:hypothetical protein
MYQVTTVKKPTGPTSEEDFGGAVMEYSRRSETHCGGILSDEFDGMKFARLALARNTGMQSMVKVGRYVSDHRETLPGLLQLPVGKLTDEDLLTYLTARWFAPLDASATDDGRLAIVKASQNMTKNQRDEFVIWMHGAFSRTELASIQIVYGVFHSERNVVFNIKTDIDTTPEKFKEYLTTMVEVEVMETFAFPRLLYIILDLLFTNLFGVSDSMASYCTDGEELPRVYATCMHAIVTKYQKVLYKVMTTISPKPIPLETVCYNMRKGIFKHAMRNVQWYTCPDVSMKKRMNNFTCRVLEGINLDVYVETLTGEMLEGVAASFAKMRTDFSDEKKASKMHEKNASKYKKLLALLGHQAEESDSDEFDAEMVHGSAAMKTGQ